MCRRQNDLKPVPPKEQIGSAKGWAVHAAVTAQPLNWEAEHAGTSMLLLSLIQPPA